jgi:hypothetical protein
MERLILRKGNGMMKKPISVFLAVMMILAIGAPASAEMTHQNPVYELYSAEGVYTDSVGNEETYSYHVPQIFADSPAADEINAEIAANFGERVETQFQNMEGGHSIWCRNTEWHSYWDGSQLFLLIKADVDGDCDEYGAYGYDFETDSRVTNAMILEQRGISEEEYLENLKEAARSKFLKGISGIPADILETSDYAELQERTLAWQTMEEPMFVDQFGEIETIALIGAMAGAGQYYHLLTPFVHQINIVGDSGLVASCPETAHAGDTVTVSLYDATDGDLEISVEGVDGTRVDWLEYQFVMPAQDVDVKVEFIGNGLA